MPALLQRCGARMGITPQRGRQFFKFMASGLPMFLVAIPLNVALVELARFPKAPAYALVLVVQVSLNFFICRYFVFDRQRPASLFAQFRAFFFGIMMFRVFDWGLYSLLTAVFHLPYVAVQLFNVALFSVLKFLFAEWVFLRKADAPPRFTPPSAS